MNIETTAPGTFAPPPPTHESDLIHRLRGGDEVAYEALVRQYGGRMLAIARRFFPNDQDADDSVQDAFISVFQSIESFEATSKLSTWLHRIVVNACLMRIRSQRRRETPSLEDHLPRFASDGHHTESISAWTCPVSQNMQAETREQVRNAINDMPGPYREVLLLRDIEEFDTEETARLLNITPGNVKTKLHRARQALRSQLEATCMQMAQV